MSDWRSVAITAAATLLGAALASGFALLLARRQDRGRGRAELAAALQAHGYAADRLGMEIGQLAPPPARAARASQRAVERLPALNWSIGQLARHTVARPALQALDTYIAATNRLILIAPVEMLEALEQLNALLARIETRDADWHADWNTSWRTDWNDARGALVEAGRTAIGVDRGRRRPHRTQRP
jgi:hypothetical protein